MEIQLFDNDLSSPTLDQVLTTKVETLKFSTRLSGGFWICTFQIAGDLFDFWDWFKRKIYYRVLITDIEKTLFEGRVEDVKYDGAGRLSITAFGYYANLGDVPYRTAFNDFASVVIKAVLTANCVQISSDQDNIDATDVTITSGAGDDYQDIYPNELFEKLLAFSNSSNEQLFFAIWEDRVPYLKALDMTTLDWSVSIHDFVSFNLGISANDLWNSVYAIYQAAGVLTRTADSDDTDSQSLYGLTRQYRVPDLGTVAAAAAQAARDAYLEAHKEVWASFERLVLGDSVYDPYGAKYPSSWVRAGQTIRVRDLIPITETLDAYTRDALTTFYIRQTEYDANSHQLTIGVDTQSKYLQDILVAIMAQRRIR